MNTKLLHGLLAAFAAMLMIVSVSSCAYDDTGLKDSIASLTERIEKLEAFQDKAQSDIETLRSLIEKLQDQVTVDSVTDNGDGSYTINFSDGTTATIRNGQDGADGADGADGSDGEDGYTPPTIIVILDADGNYYWGYEYPDGSQEYLTDANGNNIPVTGEAPMIRINEETERWEYSVDGGQTWEDAGPAVGGSGDSMFSDVAEDDDYVYITLKDGTTISIPKTKELYFDFGVSGKLYFEAGETKVLDYKMAGAENISITKPDGWRASIEDEGFVITAPVAENTFAETEGEVNVLLFAGNDRNFFASVQVEIGEEPVVPVADACVGDYYYSDGTWSADLDVSKTAIGVVIWAGDPTADDPALRADHPDCVHGIAMSFAELKGVWQENYDAYGDLIETWRSANMPECESLMYWKEYYVSNGPVDRILGYQHTKVIEAFNADPANSAFPVNIVSNIASFNEDVPAPAVSSGWFLPSYMEMSCINSSNINDINAVLTSVSGGTAVSGYGAYVTSTEYVDIMPNCAATFETMFFSSGSAIKNGGCTYRYMLAF